jgi:hypothetical protein
MDDKPFQFGLMTLLAIVTAVAVVAAFPPLLIAAWLAFITVAYIQDAIQRLRSARRTNGSP